MTSAARARSSVHPSVHPSVHRQDAGSPPPITLRQGAGASPPITLRRLRRVEASARGLGWHLVELNVETHTATLECVACAARIERSLSTVLKLRRSDAVARSRSIGRCSHPFVDAVRPYLEDRPCRLLVSQRGPMNLEEIGEAMALTRERVRQIEAQALERLRKRFVADGWSEEQVRELLAHLEQRAAERAAGDEAGGDT